MCQVESSSHIQKSCIFVLNIVFVEEENALLGTLQNRTLHFICSKEMKIKKYIYITLEYYQNCTT
jgi:hypothetical protein